MSWVDKITTETDSVVSIIVNVDTWLSIALTVIKRFADQVQIKPITHLINGVSRVLQKFVNYFNGTIILTFFVSSLPALRVIFVLNLEESLLLSAAGKSIIASSLFEAGSSL